MAKKVTKVEMAGSLRDAAAVTIGGAILGRVSVGFSGSLPEPYHGVRIGFVMTQSHSDPDRDPLSLSSLSQESLNSTSSQQQMLGKHSTKTRRPIQISAKWPRASATESPTSSFSAGSFPRTHLFAASGVSD